MYKPILHYLQIKGHYESMFKRAEGPMSGKNDKLCFKAFTESYSILTHSRNTPDPKALLQMTNHRSRCLEEARSYSGLTSRTFEDGLEFTTSDINFDIRYNNNSEYYGIHTFSDFW